MAAIDPFNRANGPLGAAWITGSDPTAYQIVSNQCVRTAVGNDYNVYLSALPGADMYVEADIDVSAMAGGAYAGVIARVGSGGLGQYLYMGVVRPGAVTLAKVVNYAYSEIVTYSLGHGSTMHVRLEVQGTQLSFFVDGFLAAQANDSSLTTGQTTGLVGQNGAKFDNYRIDALASAPFPLYPDSATHVHVSGVPILGPLAVVVDDSSHVSTSTDNVSFGMPAALMVSDALHNHIAGVPAIAGLGTLFPDDSKHLHVADAPTLYVPPYLVPADAKHVQVSGTPTLLGVNSTLVVNAATHVHIGGKPTLGLSTPTPARSLQVHVIVCTYLGDGEYDIGKTAAWVNNFANTLFFYDLNYGTAGRKYAVDYAKTFPDAQFAYHPATSKGFYEDAALFRQMAFQAGLAAWNYQDGDWVVFIDASESLSTATPFEQLVTDDEWPFLLNTLLVEARAATAPSLKLPFFVFLQQGAVTEGYMAADNVLGNNLTVQINMIAAAIAVETDPVKKAEYQGYLDTSLMLQAANNSVLYWTCDPHYMTGTQYLDRMFRVSYLKAQAVGAQAWKGIDTFAQVTGSPARWANVAAYGYARFGEGPPPWTVDTDGGFANRLLLQQVRTVGLPTSYATADPAGVSHPTGTQSPAYCYLYGNFDTGDGNPAFNQYVALWRQNPRDGVWYVNYTLGPVPLDPLSGDPSVDQDLWDSQHLSTTGPVGTGQP